MQWSECVLEPRTLTYHAVIASGDALEGRRALRSRRSGSDEPHPSSLLVEFRHSPFSSHGCTRCRTANDARIIVGSEQFETGAVLTGQWVKIADASAAPTYTFEPPLYVAHTTVRAFALSF
jgi:hypothetical protein